MTNSQIIALLRLRGFTPSAINLYLVLRDQANDRGEVIFDFNDFSSFIQLQRRSFSVLVAELADGHLVTRVGQSRLWVHEVPPPDQEDKTLILNSQSAIYRAVLLLYLMFGYESPEQLSTEERAEYQKALHSSTYFEEWQSKKPHTPAQKNADPSRQINKDINININKFKSTGNISEKKPIPRIEELNPPIKTREELQQYKLQCQAMLKRFDYREFNDSKRTRFDLVELAVLALRLDIIDIQDLNTAFNKAYELRRKGELDAIYAYIHGTLRQAIKTDGRYSMPRIMPNNERRKRAMGIKALEKRITERELEEASR